MNPKGAGSAGRVIEVTDVRRSLSLARGGSELEGEEEKVLRMRFGAGVADRGAPLPRAAGTNRALAAELSSIELQLFKAMQARPFAAAPGRGGAGDGALRADERAKEKIVRALRKKR
jgi:hypothetical protein